MIPMTQKNEKRDDIMDLSNLIFQRVKMLEEKSSPVLFDDILNIINRSEQELRIILSELIKGNKINFCL